ncbi:hypothetical protein P4O66_002246 [Electrophorus voltai]|uniref:Uncharacterized protein n=1 Tax=Electrophorus voltai TaxID=2609070 RepID=A0AAD9DQ42_9TELE|nr:hypothetical protein P4O66_002246 [Electrophorus voltai]
MAVPRRSPSKLMELERFCKEEWEKLSKNRTNGTNKITNTPLISTQWPQHSRGRIHQIAKVKVSESQ